MAPSRGHGQRRARGRAGRRPSRPLRRTLPQRPATPPVPTRRHDHALELAKSPSARFVLRFVAVAAPLLFLYAYPYEPGSFMSVSFERFLSGYARAAGALLHAIDPTVSVSGNQISGRFPLAIVRDCDAMQVNILFVSAVAAFPSGLGRRLAGASVGVALLVLANLARIVSLYVIGVASPDSFELAHREVWPLVLMAVALAIFLGFTRSERRDLRDEPSPSPA